MKKIYLVISILFFPLIMNAQSQDKEYGRYRLHKKWASNDTVYIKIGTKIDTLKAGWTLK